MLAKAYRLNDYFATAVETRNLREDTALYHLDREDEFEHNYPRWYEFTPEHVTE